MRILVLWADTGSPNLGVRALGAGTAALVHRIWPDASITFQNYGHRAPELPFGRLRSLAKERLTASLGMQQWLAGFDLVIDSRSGDSFSDIYGLRRLAVMGAVSEFASQAGVPVVLGPQTIGPFQTRSGRVLARRSLTRASVVMARDSASAECSSGLGRPVDVVTTDVVFAIARPRVARTRDVIFNISGLLWHDNPHVDSARYRDLVTRVYRSLVSEGREVTLLAHVVNPSSLTQGSLDLQGPQPATSPNLDNDVPAIQDFARRVAPDCEIIIPTGLSDVRSTIASGRVVIGSRMHACLNGLSVGVPAVPLAYSRKFAPLLQGLGWHHTVDLRGGDTRVGEVMREVNGDALTTDVTGVLERAHSSLATAENALRSLA
ncbi:hypothetical protein GY21_18545 [Cryobacterium roopkundense]|nr:polysaccharide pyruvyl transferase family protein [Cryobacterium roopkundense]KGJ71969.1 hypothetical protein GY21_18545 [Cryobacterium roopkundense]